jgi:uncharacterized protein (DUF1330 family)
MAAYVISEVEVLDETQGRRYRELAAASIARHGGRYLVRSAAPVVAEGEWPATCRLVLVEFPTMERLQTWYESADYAEALAVRRTALDRLLFVDGAHTAPGLGWPDTGEGQPTQPATSSPARSIPARSSPANG